MLRQCKRVPDAKLLLAGTELPIISRDDAREVGIKYLRDHSDGRESRGFLATFAPRGDGKSRYIDILCGLLASDLDLDSNTHAFLPIPITFNDMMNLDPTEWDGKPEEPKEDGDMLLKRLGGEKMSLLASTAICRRVLCTYLGGPRYWAEFRELSIGKAQFTSLSNVITAIERHFQELTGHQSLVLVAVDELIIAESRFPTFILRQLGDVLDGGSGWRKCCLTTLDAEILQKNLAAIGGALKGDTKSGRLIRYVSLPLLALETVLIEFMSRFPLWQNRKADLQILIELTSGHPRSLFVLFNLLKMPNSSSLVLATAINNFYSDASEIFDLTRSTDDNVLRMLAKSVLGETVPSHYGEPVLNSPKLEDGIPVPFIPTLSLVFLRKWAGVRRYKEDLTIASVASMVSTLLDIPVEDKGMEYFYAHFIRLRRWAFHYIHNAETTTIQEWYRGARVICGDNAKAEIRIPAFSDLPVSWDGNNGANATLALPVSESNPGYDCHEKFEEDAGSLVSFVEIKFSKVDATTVLSNKEINTKLKLMKKHPSLKKLGIDVKDVVWVAAALRHVVENKKIECDFPGTVLIFNREELLNWLGPTFRNLRSFVVSRHDQFTVKDK